MYDVDHADVVRPADGIPSCSPGAPEPVVVASEGRLIVAYYAPDKVNWDQAPPDELGEEEVVVVEFRGVHSVIFGSPNDEALHGHPLADRGLDAYGAYRVENSSWLRALERMNRVHPLHAPKPFARLGHFILTFHDSTLECAAREVAQVSVRRGTTPLDAVRAATDALD